MSELKTVSPLLDGFLVGDAISDHHGVRCYPAIRDNTDERYIVKVISIPASQAQLDALLLSGAYSDREQVLSYFKELTDGVIAEADILDRLSKLEGFIPYQAYQIVASEGGIGYDVYLLCPYKRSLEKQMCSTPPTHLGAVNLGLDICAALAGCRRAGYLYVDLKPDNIYLTDTHGYCIGDLGFLSLASLKYASLPEKYRSSYTPPEIADAMASLNETVDIYALGLTLYQVFNNGQLPFEGAAPDTPLPPPLYADYEMAAIILKACAPLPEDRWQDPAAMGQALVNYMQRNGVNDTPIIPPPVEEQETEEAVSEFLSEEENDAELAQMLSELPEEQEPDGPAAADDAEATEAEIPEASEVETPVGSDPSEDDTADCAEGSTDAADDEDISFIDAAAAADETLPSEENASGLEAAELTEEVAEMLAQADELIEHELPEPVVAPEPIDVPIPPPILPEGEQTEEEDTAEADDDAPGEDTSEESEEIAEAEAKEPAEQPVLSPAEFQRKNKTRNILLSAVIIAVALAALIFGGRYYYSAYYLQTIDAISVSGTANEMTVSLATETDEALLVVVYTDTYGNTRSTTVSNGKATFTELIPSTQYRITVKVTGAHKLLGSTTASFTTAAQTEILNFTATSGPEDGSAILSFSVNGPDAEGWYVLYSARGIDEKRAAFTGHSVTVTDLTIGESYSFRLVPKNELYLTGTFLICYTPQKVIYAQELKVDSCSDGTLRCSWKLPEDIESTTWTVRCYNDAGYDQTVTTTDLNAEFTGLDHSTAYTVKVTAAGMTQSASVSVTADPITVTDIKTDTSKHGVLTLNWSFIGAVPAAGWELHYTVDSSAVQVLSCPEPTAAVTLYPGSHYSFDMKPVGEISSFCETFLFDAPEGDPFEGYLVTAADMSFSMLRKPPWDYWDRYSLSDEDYRSVFGADETMAFLVRMLKQYNTSEDMITTTFVIRDAQGNPVRLDMQERTWGDMWDGGYCQIEVPHLPDLAGSYTIEIYFNSQYVTSQHFAMEFVAP